MSAKYLVTHDEDYLWSALVLPIGGLMFDFMDGKIARWRNESSMLGQELDSLADLASDLAFRYLARCPDRTSFHTDLFWRGTRALSVHHRSPHVLGHSMSYGIHLLWLG